MFDQARISIPRIGYPTLLETCGKPVTRREGRFEQTMYLFFDQDMDYFIGS